MPGVPLLKRWHADVVAVVATVAALALQLALAGQLMDELSLVIFTVPIMLGAPSALSVHRQGARRPDRAPAGLQPPRRRQAHHRGLVADVPMFRLVLRVGGRWLRRRPNVVEHRAGSAYGTIIPDGRRRTCSRHHAARAESPASPPAGGTEEAVHQGKVLSSAKAGSGSFPTCTTTISDSGCTLPRGRLPPRAGATLMIPRKVLGYH